MKRRVWKFAWLLLGLIIVHGAVRGRTIKVHVISPSGESMSGARRHPPPGMFSGMFSARSIPAPGEHWISYSRPWIWPKKISVCLDTPSDHCVRKSSATLWPWSSACVDIVVDPEPSLTLAETASPRALKGIRCKLFRTKSSTKCSEPTDDSQYLEFSALGRVCFPLLQRECLYSVWAHVPELDSYVDVRALQPGDQTVHRVQLRRGHRVDGRIKCPVRLTYFSVFARLGDERYPWSAEARRIGEGEFCLRGLPAGRWVISARGIQLGRSSRAWEGSKTISVPYSGTLVLGMVVAAQ